MFKEMLLVHVEVEKSINIVVGKNKMIDIHQDGKEHS
jgi:hypothetical protein